MLNQKGIVTHLTFSGGRSKLLNYSRLLYDLPVICSVYHVIFVMEINGDLIYYDYVKGSVRMSTNTL